MDKKELLSKCKIILETKVGSHLYGTNTPSSDIDYCGIFIAPIDYYLGFKHIKEIDLSVVDKLENGKNSKDAIDRKYYELRHFCQLALDGNPNIVEMLFANEFEILTEEGKLLVDNRFNFLSNRIYDRFMGYAFSQKKKMMIKTENYTMLKLALEVLDGQLNNDTHKFLSDYIVDCSTNNIEVYSKLFDGKCNKEFWNISDVQIPKNLTIKKVYQMLKPRFDKFGHRAELITKYGMDVKFSSHCVRLLYEGAELLETGNLTFPMKQKELLLDIKNGKYTYNEVIKMIDELETDMRNIKENSVLTNKPKTDKIESLVMGMVFSSF